MATASCATKPTFIAVSVIRFILIYNVACLQMSLLRECSPSCISDQNRPTLTIDCTITTSLMCFVDISRYITITNRRAPALPVSNINFVCQSEYKILFKDSVNAEQSQRRPRCSFNFQRTLHSIDKISGTAGSKNENQEPNYTRGSESHYDRQWCQNI